jgi:hypothetical protein
VAWRGDSRKADGVVRKMERVAQAAPRLGRRDEARQSGLWAYVRFDAMRGLENKRRRD